MKKVEIKKENEEEEREREKRKERVDSFLQGRVKCQRFLRQKERTRKEFGSNNTKIRKYENTKTRNEIKLTSSSESCPKRGIAVWLTSIISTFKSGRRTKDQQISSEQIRSDQTLFSAIHVASCVCVCV